MSTAERAERWQESELAILRDHYANGRMSLTNYTIEVTETLRRADGWARDGSPPPVDHAWIREQQSHQEPF